jgi:hypothetical protein
MNGANAIAMKHNTRRMKAQRPGIMLPMSIAPPQALDANSKNLVVLQAVKIDARPLLSAKTPVRVIWGKGREHSQRSGAFLVETEFFFL